MPSPSLAEVQAALAARILGNGDSSEFEAWLRVPRRADPMARLSVHRDGYAARIGSSLTEAFPAVANILGEGSVANLVHRFIERGRPRERNLNRIGRTLPAFLGDDPLTRELPFLPDLAALEWAIFECFHSAAGSPFDPATLASFSLDDWARTRISFRPGTAVVSAAWPIRELWRTRDLDRSEIEVDLTDRPEHVLVHRIGHSVEPRSVETLEAHALERLLSGARLGEVMADLSEQGAQPQRVSDLFSGWLSLGLVSGCTVG